MVIGFSFLCNFGFGYLPTNRCIGFMAWNEILCQGARRNEGSGGDKKVQNMLIDDPSCPLTQTLNTGQ